jgi:hypothetical protein
VPGRELQCRRDLLGAAVRREDQVPRAFLGIVHGASDPSVSLPALRERRLIVRGSRDKRMREADPASFDLDEAGACGVLEMLRIERVGPGLGERRQLEQRCLDVSRQLTEPRLDELLEAGRRERLVRLREREVRGCDLERRERVARGDAVNPHDLRPWERGLEAVLQEPMQGTEAEGPNGQANAGLELEHHGRSRVPCKEDGDSIRLHEPQRKDESRRRRRIHPLLAVDRDDHGLRARKMTKHTENREADRPRLQRRRARLAKTQGRFERPALRRRQSFERVVEGRAEQIREGAERAPRSDFRRTAREHRVRTLTRASQDGLPQRRLPDPRVALQDERSRPGRRGGEERLDGGELFVPPDERRRVCRLPVRGNAQVLEARVDCEGDHDRVRTEPLREPDRAGDVCAGGDAGKDPLLPRESPRHVDRHVVLDLRDLVDPLGVPARGNHAGPALRGEWALRATRDRGGAGRLERADVHAVRFQRLRHSHERAGRSDTLDERRHPTLRLLPDLAAQPVAHGRHDVRAGELQRGVVIR